MDNIPESSPVFSIRHEHHSLSATSFSHHGLRMSTRIYCRSPINEFFECLARVNPDKHCCARSCSAEFAVFSAPFEYEWDRIVFHLIEGLVDDGPTTNMRRHMCTAGITSPVTVKAIQAKSKNEDFG